MLNMYTGSLAQPTVNSWLFDVDRLLGRFYNEHVRLGREGRQHLADLRDRNLDRLSSGLEKLGKLRGASTAGFESSRDQGSYAMHTLNQHPFWLRCCGEAGDTGVSTSSAPHPQLPAW
jgi:hypothetical protein